MTKLETKTINLLSNYPEQEFYSQEIADKLNCSKASASIILKFLTAKKIVFKDVKGNMKFYRINPGNTEVKKIRISQAIEVINKILPKLKKDALRVILFGSASRGEQTAASDIDLFVLSRAKDAVIKVIKVADKKSVIKAIIKNPSEWSETEIKDPELYNEIKNGIVLYEYAPRI